MTTDPDQIRLEIAALLTDLPAADAPDADVEAIAVRLEEAHDLLVRALESVDRGSPGGTIAAPGHER
jgi:hypothetical protein